MTLPPPITSRTNARVKTLRASLSGKASRPGELVGIEGVNLIGEALRSGLQFDTAEPDPSLTPRHPVTRKRFGTG